MSQTEGRKSTSTDTGTETDTASFVTPLATPTQLSRFSSRLNLDDEATPGKSQQTNSERSGTATPTGPKKSNSAGLSFADIYPSPILNDNVARPLSRDAATSTTSNLAVEPGLEAEKEAIASVSLHSHHQDDESESKTLRENSARVSEKEVPEESNNTKIELDAAPRDVTGPMTGVNGSAADVENDDDEDVVYPGGLALGLITAGLLLATFVIALDNTIIGKPGRIVT